MSGVYPVGPGGPGVDSFATVQEAASVLSSRGLAGDVDFPIATGTYVGPVALRSVAGSGVFRTTFRSPQLPATIDAGGARFAFSVESTDNVSLHRLLFTGARGSGSAGVRFVDSDHGHVRSGRPGDSSEVGILAMRCDSLRLDSTRIEGALAGPGSRGVELRDCRWVEVYRCSMPATVGTGMLVAGGSDVSVYRMTAMDPLVHGLRLENTQHATFWRCFFRGAPEYGLHAVGATGAYFDSITTTGATVVGAYFEECDSLVYKIPMIVTDAPHAFWLARSQGCSVRVLSAMGQPAVGLFFDRSPGCVVESTQVMGVQSDTGFGVVIDSCPNSSFTLTQMVGNFRRGIVVNRSDRVRLRHARVRGTVNEAAISVENSNGVNIGPCSLNTVSGVAGGAGVLLAGDCSDDTLQGMTVLAEAQHGILMQGSGVRNIVTANSFLSGWTGDGVCFDGTGAPRLFYNTIVSPEDAGVAGVRFRDVAGAESKDNVIWNRGLASSYCYRVDTGSPFVPGSSDHNDLYVSGPDGATARVGDTVFAGLEDWRAHGSLPDAHSLARNPLFDSLGDFHITELSPCRDSGTPVPGFLFDHDGDDRDAVSPDIGADEYRPGGVTVASPIPVAARLVLRGNPAGTRCHFDYKLDIAAEVRIRLLDVAGRAVMTHDAGRHDAGTHAATLDLTGVPAGVYLLEIKAGASVSKARLVHR